MKKTSSLVLSLSLLLTPASQLLAATGDTVADESTGNGTGSIEIIQQNKENPNILGEWSLLRPGNIRLESKTPKYELSGVIEGKYTILAETPDAGGAFIDLYRNGELELNQVKRQITFSVAAGDEIRLVINYKYVRTGGVTVNSDPKGLSFTLKGPNNTEWKDKTSFSVEDAPEGLYTVYFDPIEGCVTPKPKSDRLMKDGRVNLTVKYDCAGVEALRENENVQNSLEYVTVDLDGRKTVYSDVPLGQWFSAPIHTVIKTRIMSGDTDENGVPTGAYRPSSEVTIAELAKIAHTIASLDPYRSAGEPRNEAARNTWFAPFIRSAEERDWLVYRDVTLDPIRPATRAEVVATFLQALDIPVDWAKGNMFTDVTTRTLYADCVETAAEDGIIAGYTDSNGDPTGEFGPNKSLNRAEMAKILSKVMDLYLENTPEISGESY